MSAVLLDFPTRASMRALIEKGDYKEANQALAFVQSAFEQGSINDRELAKAFTAFDCYIPAIADTLENWVEAMPNSYVARLARAKYLVAKAGFYRGYGLPRDVSQENWDVFGACFKRAHEDLQRSLELTAKPILSHILLMHMSILGGGDFVSQYQSALKLYPVSLEARRKMIWHLRPEWGGSLEQLKAYIDSEEHADLPQEERTSMQSRYHEARGHWFEHFEKDHAQAKKAYEKAIEIKRTASGLSSLGGLVLQTNLSQAVGILEEAHKLDPLDTYIQTMYATALYASSKGKRKAEAKRLLEDAANWGESLAKESLEKLSSFSITPSLLFNLAGRIVRLIAALIVLVVSSFLLLRAIFGS